MTDRSYVLWVLKWKHFPWNVYTSLRQGHLREDNMPTNWHCFSCNSELAEKPELSLCSLEHSRWTTKAGLKDFCMFLRRMSRVNESFQTKHVLRRQENDLKNVYWKRKGKKQWIFNHTCHFVSFKTNSWSHNSVGKLILLKVLKCS